MISRANRVNLLIGTGHFLSHFYMLILPPLFVVWQDDFRVSFAELGIAVALMSGVTALLQTPVGFLVDRHGARPFLVGGTLLMSLTICAMGLATEFWQILVLAALSGVGNSVIHPADYAILAGSIPKERMGRAFGLHTFAGNLGFSAGPPIIALLMGVMGWRSAVMLLGALGVPVVATILLQSRILVDQHRPHPAQTGPAVSGRALLLTRSRAGHQPDPARRDGQGRGAAGADRQGVRVRQRRIAAGLRADARAVRVFNRPSPA